MRHNYSFFLYFDSVIVRHESLGTEEMKAFVTKRHTFVLRRLASTLS